jgi:acyl carrier protein
VPPPFPGLITLTVAFRPLPATDIYPALLNGAATLPFSVKDGVEEALSDIWSEVLQIQEIGVHDHFLELGGDSLLATQVAARVIDRFGLSLPASAVRQAPTIDAMAVLVLAELMGEAPGAH